jgi:NADH-quinone oxidoreductase subunit N
MEQLTIPAINLWAIGPFLVVTITAMIVLVGGLFRSLETSPALPAISVIGLIVALAVSIGFWGQQATWFNQMIATDAFAGFFSIVILIASVIAILMSTSQARSPWISPGEYYSLLLFCSAGMLLLAQATNLIMVVIGIELLSLSLYVLAGFVRARQTSLEASMKYFLLGAFALGFLIYGSALVFGATASTSFAGIAAAVTAPGPANALVNPLFLVGLGLLIVGIAFKLSVVPFHQWTPDVYEGAPTAIAGFMSVGTKVAVFAVAIRFLTFAVPQAQPDWSVVLWGLAILTMVVGNVAAVVQSSLKRMLAYSSIAQAGYILIAVVAGGPLGTASVMFYLLAYTFMNLGAFTVLLALGQTSDDNPTLNDLIGLGQRAPLAAMAMTVFMLSLAGIPPTAGFLAKVYVFTAGVQAGYVDMVIIGVLTSAIAVFYYLRVVVNMYMRAPTTVEAESATSRMAILPVPLTGVLPVLLVILVGATLILGIVPVLPLDIAQAAVIGLR